MQTEFKNKCLTTERFLKLITREIITPEGEIELNAGRYTVRVWVANRGDRPIDVGSHFHFYEVNKAWQFDREQTQGIRLDIPAGKAVRIQLRDEREVVLVPFAGERQVYGFNGKINGQLGELILAQIT